MIRIAEGSLEAYTAALSWDELVWVVGKVLGFDIANAQGKKFLEFPNLKLLSVDEKVIKEAQRIVEIYDLKPRDAIHVGCAIKNKIKEIVSDDSDFDRVEEIKRIEPEKL